MQLKRLVHFYCLPLGLDNPDQKSKKRKYFLVVLPPIQLVNEGASEINFSYVEHSFWNLLVGVVVTMIMMKIGENYVI